MGLIELFTNPPEVIIGKTTTLAEGFLAVDIPNAASQKPDDLRKAVKAKKSEGIDVD